MEVFQSVPTGASSFIPLHPLLPLLSSVDFSGFSDYDYDIRSDIITDDSDYYTEHTDASDDLDSLKPELKARFQNERRISRSRILELERELEGQQDHYRANEAANQRQILALQREVEGMW